MKLEVACAVLLIALSSQSQAMQWRSNPMRDTAVQNKSMPDLVIRQVVSRQGDDKKLRAHVVNIGEADAGGGNLMLYYHRAGQVVKRGTSVPAIQKGKDLRVDVNKHKPPAAASSISLRVDDPDRVKESNELNNSYKVK